MVRRNLRHVSITLLFYFAILVLFASNVDASIHAQPNHRRLLKKRTPQLLGFPGPSTVQNSGKDTLAPASVSPSTSVSTAATPTIVTPTTAPLSSTSSSGPTDSASSSSTSSPSSSTSSTTASSVLPTSTSASTLSSIVLPASSASSASRSSETLTQTDTASSILPSVPAQAQGNVSKDSHKRTTITVIIAVASGVGGVAILWTLFRKWKLGRSSKFDERLQPIDWQPPSEGAHRPVSNASSFHSGVQGFGSEHGNNHVQNKAIAPLPEHDFTALPSSHLAAIGGYADLARGPSPQPPQMQEAYSRHSPIMNRPNYDVNVPLHHQTGYGGRDAYDYTGYNNASLRH